MDLDVENPVVIDSLWHGSASYSWAEDIPMVEFEFDVDVSGLSTLIYGELDERLFKIKMRSSENIISDNEGDLECDAPETYPDELKYVPGTLLHISGIVREEDFDDVESIFDDLNLAVVNSDSYVVNL